MSADSQHQLPLFAVTSPCYDPLPGCKYETDLWRPEDAQAFFDELFKLHWEQHTGMPRKFQWMGVPPGADSYSGGTPIAGKMYGEKLTPIAWTPAVLAIKKKVEEVTGETFDSLNLNLYRDNRDAVGWHRDKENEGLWTASIASVSLGAIRTLQVRRGWDGKIHPLPLTPGSLVVMPPGYQRDHVHCLAKTSIPCGPRINLTFRRMIPTAKDLVKP